MGCDSYMVDQIEFCENLPVYPQQKWYKRAKPSTVVNAVDNIFPPEA